MRFWKIIPALLLLFLCCKVNAQTFIKSDFIGAWAVDSISLIQMQHPISKNLLAEIEQQKIKFKQSVFVFKNDGVFHLQTTEKNDAVQAAFWEVNDEGNVTIIRIWKNSDRSGKELLIILPNKKNGQIEFWIDSTVLKLMMNKHLKG